MNADAINGVIVSAVNADSIYSGWIPAELKLPVIFRGFDPLIYRSLLKNEQNCGTGSKEVRLWVG
jgi:hypothetical protein